GPTGDYRELQGARPDELAAMLPTPEARRQWVAGMYQSRLWASPGTFGRVDVDFMTEPFADEDRLRAGWSAYQRRHRRRADAAPLGHRRPRGRRGLRVVQRARVHGSHRPAPDPGGRALPPVG